MLKKINKFFDQLEDGVRGRLSRHPILYAFIGGAGVVIFWRGVWHTADFVSYSLAFRRSGLSADLIEAVWWDGPLSLLIGSALLLLTGVLVSSFIGNELIISGIKKEKKITEKTEAELLEEVALVADIKKDVEKMQRRLDDLEFEKKL